MDNVDNLRAELKEINDRDEGTLSDFVRISEIKAELLYLTGSNQ